MSKRILVGWAEDVYWSSIKNDINYYIGNDGIELCLMSALVDVFHIKDGLRKKNRRFDLLVLDCKMDEEHHTCYQICNNTTADLETKAKEMDSWACDYYEKQKDIGGLFIWSYFRNSKCEPSPKRTIIYSAHQDIQSKYTILRDLDIMRFRPKNEYITTLSEDPLIRWSKLYSRVEACDIKTLTFLLNTGNDLVKISIEDISLCNPNHEKKQYYILDVALSAEKEQSGRVYLVPLVKDLYECVRGVSKYCEFLKDLEEIGFEYVKSEEVDKELLAKALSISPADIGKKLSDTAEGWTLKSLFPAYYNEGAIFKANRGKQAELEQKLRRESVINWTYELGRTLRVGAYFSNGHSGQAAPSYPSGSNVTVSADATTQVPADCLRAANDMFQERTGFRLPYEGAGAYTRCLDSDNRICRRYIISEMENQTNLAINNCKNVLRELNFEEKSVHLKIKGDFSWDGENISCENEPIQIAGNSFPVLALYPSLDIEGLPNTENKVLVQGATQSQWGIDSILSTGYFKDVFNRSEWNKNSSDNQALIFCKGQVLWDKEAAGESVFRYFRFLCLARTTLPWKKENLEACDFLNKTKRLDWFNKGLHKHVRVYVLSNYRSEEYLFFDLALGVGQKCHISKEAVPTPIKEAHSCVIRSLSEEGKYQWVSFLFIGYDLIDYRSA
jgi:hypothetical protein